MPTPGDPSPQSPPTAAGLPRSSLHSPAQDAVRAVPGHTSRPPGLSKRTHSPRLLSGANTKPLAGSIRLSVPSLPLPLHTPTHTPTAGPDYLVPWFVPSCLTLKPGCKCSDIRACTRWQAQRRLLAGVCFDGLGGRASWLRDAVAQGTATEVCARVGTEALGSRHGRRCARGSPAGAH